MIDKELLKERFSKSLKTYNTNATIQNAMAKELIKLLPTTKFNSILEVGCGSGILTKYVCEKVSYNNYVLNDIVQDCKQYIEKIIPQGNFIVGDIEDIPFNSSFDLIISNACLQWCNDLNKIISKLVGLLNKNGTLIFSMFGNKNLTEIKQITNIGLNYYSLEDLKELLIDYNIVLLKEEIKKIYFQTPIQILHHLKFTGVNTLSNVNWTKTKLKDFEYKYKLYSENNKIPLTYHPIFVVIKKLE